MKMKKIRMDRDDLMTATVAVLIIVIGIFYYKLVFVPQLELANIEQEKFKQERKKVEECLSNTEAIEERLEKENKELSKVGMDSTSLVLEGVYYYKSKDRCVYSMKSVLIGEFAGQSSYFIRDALTDKRLYKFFVDRQSDEYEAFLTSLPKD